MLKLFFALVIIGIILICAELFLPGGIAGIVGALALIGAMALSFSVFPGYGFLVSSLLLFLMVLSLILWAKFFPRCRLGKKMTVGVDLKSARVGYEQSSKYIGKTGVAISQLRPAGFAIIEGKRVDVVTQGELIEKGENIKVVDVKGNRIIVARTDRDNVNTGG